MTRNMCGAVIVVAGFHFNQVSVPISELHVAWEGIVMVTQVQEASAIWMGDSSTAISWLNRMDSNSTIPSMSS